MPTGRGRGPADSTPDHTVTDTGLGLADLVVALAVVVLLGSLSVPATARAVEAGRVRHAAGFVAAMLRAARQRAAADSRAAGVVFEDTARGWTLRLCVDENGDGLSRRDVADGTDVCPEDSVLLADRFAEVWIAVDPLLRDPAGQPGSSDPVRFGSTDVASFSPAGDATPGSVFIRSRAGTQFCVRVGGITGRTRILRYDAGARVWRP